MAKKIYKVEVEIKETYKRTFLVQADSEQDATKKIEANICGGNDFVYDKTTESLIDQDIDTVCVGIEDNPSQYTKDRFENDPDDIIIANKHLKH